MAFAVPPRSSSILINEANQLRRRGQTPSQMPDGGFEPLNDEIPARDLRPSPEDYAIAGQLWERAVAAITPKNRVPFILMFAYGCQHKEIARALKLTDAAVKARIHNARQTLLKTLKEA